MSFSIEKMGAPLLFSGLNDLKSLYYNLSYLVAIKQAGPAQCLPFSRIP